MQAFDPKNTLKGLGELAGILSAIDQGKLQLSDFQSKMNKSLEKGILENNREEALDFFLDLSVELGASKTYGKILRGAADVFGSQGLDVAVSEILKSAGVSRRTFYQFFSNSEQVCETIYALSLSIGRIYLKSRLEIIDSPEELFRDISRSYFKFYQIGGLLMCRLTGLAMITNTNMNLIYKNHLELISLWVYEKTSNHLNKDIDQLIIKSYFMTLTAMVLDSSLNVHTPKEEKAKISKALDTYTDIWLRGINT